MSIPPFSEKKNIGESLEEAYKNAMDKNWIIHPNHIYIYYIYNHNFNNGNIKNI